MTETLPPKAPQPPKRSMGLKLLLVCGLALLMSIPACFVWALIYERTSRAQDVVDELSQMAGGPQQFMGPVLSIPYEVPAQPARPGVDAQPRTTGAYIVFPKTAEASGSMTTETLERGLFHAPKWNADLTMKSAFDLTGAGSQAPRNAVLDWSRAEIVVGATNARGAKTNTLMLGGKSVILQPALSLDAIGGDQDYRMERGRRIEPTQHGLQFFGAPAGALATPGSSFEATAHLTFSGAQRFAFLPYGENTTASMTGDWPGPSYEGCIPTTTHADVAPAGSSPAKGKGYFAATWSLPYTARGIGGQGSEHILSDLSACPLGLSLVETANPYQAVSRSLKYAPIFLGLVFFAYFVFESTQKKRMHPAQYVLVGLAQLIFYLLLLALAERVGFDLGFAAAAGATVILISAYAAWTFENRAQGVVAFIAFSILYSLIYVLMRLQDWALLVGAVASFTAIAGVMYFTRKLDWYGDKGQAAA